MTRLLSPVAFALFLMSSASAQASCLPSDIRSKLSQIESRFGSIKIVSTHRAGARMPGGRVSYHASCRAVDFNPPSGKYDAVVSWLHANHSGGVGTYGCGMHHIHVDNGPKIHFHTCAR
jgi:uncharacterized protein YcbK (DUF882 family)